MFVRVFVQVVKIERDKDRPSRRDERKNSQDDGHFSYRFVSIDSSVPSRLSRAIDEMCGLIEKSLTDALALVKSNFTK